MSSPTIPAHTLTLYPRLGMSIFQQGFSSDQYLRFCRFIVPLFVKVASSVNKILAGKSSFTRSRSVIHRANRVRDCRSPAVSSWWFCTWYARIPRSCLRTCRSVSRLQPVKGMIGTSDIPKIKTSWLKFFAINF